MNESADKLLNIEHLLMQEIFKGVNMTSLVNLSAKFLDCPVAFYMLNLTELVYSDNYPKEAAEDLVNCRVRSTPEEKAKWTGIFNNGIRKSEPVIQSWPYQRYRSLVCGSKINGSLIGYITIPQTNQILEEIDPQLVQLIAKIYGIALLIQEHSHLESSEHSLLWGLLTDRIDINYLRRNILNPAFGNLKTYRMLWFVGKNGDEKTLTDIAVDEFLSCVHYKLTITFEEGYAVLIDGHDDKGEEELCAAAEKMNILIGASDIFHNIEYTKINFLNAQHALRYASIIGKVSGIAQFDDYKLFHLITLSNERLDLSEYMSNRINIIETYDIKNNTEYLNTLRAYLNYNQNIKAVAKTLFVHTNTVNYRMRRLQEMFKIDLRDTSQIASLVCSLIIHDNFIPNNG